MSTLQIASEEAMARLGSAIAEQLRPGDRVGLIGPLAAGKTVLARGIARGLGFDGPVTSPTYTIVNEYVTPRGPLRHIDAYRLDSAAEFLDLGLPEPPEDGAFELVEWVDRLGREVGTSLLVTVVAIEGDDRTIEFDARGLGPERAEAFAAMIRTFPERA